MAADPQPPDYLNGLVFQMIQEWPDNEGDYAFADRVTKAIWFQIVAQGLITIADNGGGTVLVLALGGSA